MKKRAKEQASGYSSVESKKVKKAYAAAAHERKSLTSNE